MRGLPTVAQWSCFHITLFLALWSGSCNSAGDQNGAAPPSFEMKMMYKYSEVFRELMKGRPGMAQKVSQWPLHGTPQYYHELALFDQHRHVSRKLLATDAYTLLPSNTTMLVHNLGGLHYSFILLGTPAKEFLVALDTGSDLLWVPCDCKQCSVADWASYGLSIPGVEFAVYSPSNSTTSKPVLCNDLVCTSTLVPGPCNISAPQSCTYDVNYVSANTSSSGTIVQDIVYLTSETTMGSKLSSQIYFGCGDLQTGAFLNGGAPNGLFGLGPDIYSVPTTFARNGVTKNVFSMCFSSADGSGKLVFGRKPAAALQSTPIIPVLPSVFYVLGIEGFVAGGVRLNVTQKVVFDTGTSLTTFPSDIVKAVGDSIAMASSLTSFPYISIQDSQTLTFSYCWNITTTAELDSLSSLSIVFSKGGELSITRPLLGFVNQAGDLLFVCLGMLVSDSSSTLPIIGFNFMGDYEYFFDQETSTFSWGATNCSGTESTNTTVAISPEASVPAPSESVAGVAPKMSPPSPSALVNNFPPPPPSSPFSLFSESPSISFHQLPLLLLVSLTFIFLHSK